MISEQQKAERRKYIGSSDAAAILGLSRYATAEDVRLDKLGRVSDWDGNTATSAGNYLEPAIRAWAADQLGLDLLADKMVVHRNGIMAANLDSYHAGERVIVECKSTGIVGPPDPGYGAADSDEVPDAVAVQVQHQLACTGYDLAYVAALIGGIGFRLYRLPRDVEFIAGLEKALERFWRVNVLGDVPAPNCLASMDTMRRLKRQPTKIVDIRHAKLKAYQDLKAEESALSDRLEAAKRELMADLGDAEAGAVDGVVVCTFEANKKGVRSLKLKGAA
jgi:putative phage-type endonuclease